MSSGFKMLQSSDYDETAKFCSMFDRFFDCLNTRNANEGRQKRKPDLDPYRSVEDKRFDVSILYGVLHDVLLCSTWQCTCITLILLVHVVTQQRV